MLLTQNIRVNTMFAIDLDYESIMHWFHSNSRIVAIGAILHCAVKEIF